MRLRASFGFAAAVLVLAVSCLSPASARILGGKNGSLLYVADSATSTVFVLDAQNINAPFLGAITAGVNAPSSVAVDKSGFLYVANTGTGTIAVFKPGASSPYRAITLRGAGTPEALAAGPDGSLIAGFGGSTGGTIAVFAKGTARPSRTMSLPLEGAAQVALASLSVGSGAIYASIERSPSGPDQLLKFPAIASSGIDTSLTPGSGEAFDGAGNFYLGSGSEVEVYGAGMGRPKYAITSQIENAGQLGVAPDGALFVPNGDYYVCGRFLEPGYITMYASGSENADATASWSGLVNPVSVALRLPS